MVEDWKIKYNVLDDGNVFYSNALFKNNCGEIVLQKIPFKVYYLFGENKVGRALVVNGELVQSRILQNKRIEYNKYQFDPEELHRPIICVFDTTIRLTEKKVEQIDLTSKLPPQKQKQYYSYDDIVPKNISIACERDQHVYEFEYTAALCNRGYNFKGYGTIHSTFYNIELKFKSLKTNDEQVIYKTPDDSNYNISGISICNINDDKTPDVILSVSSEYGKWNLVYLSKDNALEYVGYNEVYFMGP